MVYPLHRHLISSSSKLLVQATNELLKVSGLHIVGTAKEKAGVLSFVLVAFKTEEVGAHLKKWHSLFAPGTIVHSLACVDLATRVPYAPRCSV